MRKIVFSKNLLNASINKAINFKSLFFLVILFPIQLSCFAQTKTVIDAQETPKLSTKELKTPYIYPNPNETPEQKAVRMKWWTDAKFGLFIHWGLYSIPAAGEWHMRTKHLSKAEYSKLAAQFNPIKFNADEWMQVAQDAGMKYMAITSKHHDGFAMFDSKASDYNIVKATPFKRDILKELSVAAPKHGVGFGVYYSGMADWYHPGGGAGEPKWDSLQNGNTDRYIDEIAVKQVHELMNNYGQIGEVWFDNDGSKGMTPERANRIYAELKNQPNVCVTPRLGGTGDFSVQEQRIQPLPPLDLYWEGALTVNGAWGYREWPTKPLPFLLQKMIDVFSKGGNVILNVGPNAAGQFPADNIERLHQIGNWMKVNGEAIYGSVAGLYDYLSWGRTTRKGNTLYLHVFNWPKDGVLKVPNITSVKNVRLLADAKKKITWKTAQGKLLLDLPFPAPDTVATVIALELDKMPVRLQSLALNKPVTTSSEQSKAKNITDNDPLTAWSADKKSKQGWIEIDLQTPQTFNTLRVGTRFSKIKKAALEYKDGTEWKTIFTDTNLPQDEYLKTFPEVKSQLIRFQVFDTENEINISSVELFGKE